MQEGCRRRSQALNDKHRLERVLVVNKNFELRGLITVKDILKSSEHPLASKDNQGRLQVGAAVGVGEGTEERVEALIEAGVDVIVVDTAHGHAQGVLSRVQWIKRVPKTSERRQPRDGDGAKALVDSGRMRSTGHRTRLDLHDADRRGIACRRSPRSRTSESAPNNDGRIADGASYSGV